MVQNGWFPTDNRDFLPFYTILAVAFGILWLALAGHSHLLKHWMPGGWGSSATLGAGSRCTTWHAAVMHTAFKIVLTCWSMTCIFRLYMYICVCARVCFNCVEVQFNSFEFLWRVGHLIVKPLVVYFEFPWVSYCASIVLLLQKVVQKAKQHCLLPVGQWGASLHR